MQQTWYFLRHGALIQSGVLSGRTDLALSELGIEQLYAKTKTLTDIDRIFSSPLQRCRQFATALSCRWQLPLSITDSLQEMDFGAWDGKSFEWLWSNTHNPSIGDFWQNPWLYTPPEAETMEAFYTRIQQWWHAQLATPNDSCNLVITHGGVIKQLLALILAFPKHDTRQQSLFDVGYGAMIKVQVYYDEQGIAWPKVVF
ncbi:hypothetical protein CWB96_04540 [Pseudoalteromonas citrea]|uniref:Histidine phosphatase family protein n=1 Tax=Pseudoalteromonas citrea TaxID=43655 RepID=A0A5S3XT75_9GAMM|nr:histidine phosphatase family protein [Pseudoalteromonas citrea]TMP45066.1 hypothetical protein CWB97_04470 [Pseudoalteromonas citrea]TMP61552.1 hypothetical protein CWB96_04540 [Pseudoalteromonas citrea]